MQSPNGPSRLDSLVLQTRYARMGRSNKQGRRTDPNCDLHCSSLRQGEGGGDDESRRSLHPGFFFCWGWSGQR